MLQNVPLLSILLFVLFLLSAFFSGSETALMSINHWRIHHLAKKNKKASLVADVLDEPGKLIGTLLFCNNLVNVAASSIATAFLLSLFGQKGIVYATILMTVLLLIFAEITPKTLANYYPEKISFFGIRFIHFLIIIFYPMISLFTWITETLLHLMNMGKPPEGLSITEEEVETILELGTKSGAIEPEQQEMLTGVLDLDQITVKEIMVPFKEVISMKYETSYFQALEIIKNTNFSRYPVYKDNIDNIVGFIHVRDLLLWSDLVSKFHLKEILRLPLFIPDSKPVQNQLVDFKKQRIHLNFVINEYGEVIGIVTLEDILEEIVGEIEDEHDRWQKKIQKLPDDSYRISGSISVRDLNRYLKLNLPETDYNTVAGMILACVGHLPKEGEKISHENITLTVEKMAGNSISEVLLTIKEKEKAR